MQKLLITLSLFISSIAIAQVDDIKPCITDSMYWLEIQKDPQILVRRKQLEDFTKNFIGPEQRVNTPGGVIYTIPIVFHVMHNYGGENISRQQILDAVEVLNQSFQKLNSDTVDVISTFQPVFANCQIQFRLATIDPNGNCTDGITRTQTTLTYSAGNNLKSLDDWDNDKYFNVWVVQHIASGAAGYAYYPGATNDVNDGVEILSTYVIGPSGGNYQSRSLAHETGHWLNLPHTWGNSNTPGLASNCNIDDGIFDTPNCSGSNPSACNLSQNTCGSGPNDTIDNVQNYMDYAACHKMFTDGQKAVMHAALNNGIQYRDNLWQEPNLIATGTEDGHIAQLCSPIADFSNKRIYVCAGQSVTFNDVSWRGTPTTWDWDCPGGTPDTASTQNVTVQYNVPGTYDVSLTASNSTGSNTLLRPLLVTVLPSIGSNNIPYSEGFETLTIPGSEWSIENEGTTNAFSITGATGATGTHSVRLLNQSGNATGTIDAIITPTLNLTNVTGTSFTFKYAFASKSSTDSSILKVFVSNNCGQSWAQRLTKYGPSLRTGSGGVTTASFVPNAAQWVTQPVTLAMNNSPSLRVKFEYTQDDGNNFYIDDINLTGFVGINEILAEQYAFNLHPNPASGSATVEMDLKESGSLKMDLYDMLGKNVTTIAQGHYSTGKHQFEIQNKYYEGIYFVSVTVNDNSFNKKIVFVK